MPHEVMTEQQVAAYLNMDVRQIRKFASREQIPARRVNDSFVFRKSDVDHWVWERMHHFDDDDLAGIERGVAAHHGFEADRPLVCPLIPDAGLFVPLLSKTREAVIRDLTRCGESLELVYDRDGLAEELRGRESLCSTALLKGVAFPHPRHPLPYEIAESFILVGLTPAGVPFGSEDGSLTRLFFLLCCKDERTHLHVLARLVRMLDDRMVVQQFMQAETPDELAELLAHRELEVLQFS